jgi:predicted secreted hydrolase
VHHAAERYARGGVGQAGVSLTPFNAWIDDWHFSQATGADPLTELQLSARDKGFGYQLRLTSTKPSVLQGDKGSARNPNRARRRITQPAVFPGQRRWRSMASAIKSAVRVARP